MSINSTQTVDDVAVSYDYQTLSFDGTGTAIIDLNYYDAGQIRIKATASLAVGSGTVAVQGDSNLFWVSPSKFTITAKSSGVDLNNTSDSLTPIHKAGVAFDLEITAVNTLGATTANYQPGQMQFLLQRTGPSSGGADGSFTYASASIIASALIPSYQNVTLTSFSSGVSAFNSANYSEVGLLNLDLQDSDYGGVSINVSGDAINIGRFIPDHFLLTTPTITESCSSNFTYGG